MPRKRSTGPAFTVPTLKELPVVERSGEHSWVEAGGRRLRLSNLDKVFWPDEGYTKGDLVAYYWTVADVMLPYLRDRPLTMKRMPDGIRGPHFYEKQAPSHTPEWMPTCRVEHGDSREGVVNYLMSNDAAGLLFVANLGCIEFHPLHARCATIDYPDYLFFDLDPFPPATFDDVCAVALHVRAAADALGLPTYPKTSGATGMQIYVGIKPGPTHEQVRELVGTVGRAIRTADPARATMEWEISKRAGKVFIDHNMNRRGANISAVYSVRPEPGASVSTPLSWDEVEAGGILPTDFTIVTLPERLSRVGDLFSSVLEKPVDLMPLLGKLGLLDDTVQDAAPKPDLAEYARKRSFDVTPEPAPHVASPGGNAFVVQKHNATRLHYDLRLERDGVMVSWAVPRGLPTTTGVRRLAVQTEDHPIDYNTFEGRIPKGEYGGGEVRIYDSGTYEALEWEPGKITVRLEGRRHRGEYHMVKTQQGWLIMLSKRSADEQPKSPPPLAPMLAEPGHDPFDDPKWRFEPKLDGVRALAYVSTDATRLLSRTGRDQTMQYPELKELAKYVNALNAVIDGEIATLDENGRPSFQLLQQRINLVAERDVEKIRKTTPVTLFAFDLLWLDGRDLMGEPLEERRRQLEDIVTEADELKLTLVVEAEGKRLFEASKALGLEGVIGKRLGSIYQPGRRSKDWRKIKALNRLDAVIIGWTPGAGSRPFGALLLGAYENGELVSIGQVGTGFTESLLETIAAKLAALETDAPPVDDPDLTKAKGVRWTRPELVCEVEYLEITRGRRLRAPSFKGLRPDKAPQDCVLEGA